MIKNSSFYVVQFKEKKTKIEKIWNIKRPLLPAFPQKTYM